MTLMAPFDTITSNRDLAARTSEKPVIGYLANTVPHEMIRAAGAFAQQITGSPEDETPDALQHMEPFFDGWVLSVFQRMLDGRLSHLSALVIPRTSEVMLQLYYFILEYKRQNPKAGFPSPILFDILHTPYDATARYNAGRLARLRDRLGQISGTAMTQESLTQAIDQADEIRGLLAQINALRTADSPTLSGAEMQRITLAASLMAPDEFSEAAKNLIFAGGTGQRNGPRMVLTGSGHDTDGFHQLVESQGAIITSDNHMHGDWRFLAPVGQGDPMQALLTKYHRNAPSTRSYPRAMNDARLIEAAERGQAKACIFFTEEWDDALGFDFPTQRDLLADRNIPVLFLKNQSYRAPDRAAQSEQIAQFLADLSSAPRSPIHKSEAVQ